MYLLVSIVLWLHIQVVHTQLLSFLKFSFFFFLRSVRGAGAFGKARSLIASTVRIWCCEKWFTQFPKGAAFQHVTTSWQRLKGTLRAWKAEVMIQRATVSGKKPFLVEYENTKIHILLVFRAIQTIKGGTALSNWAQVRMSKRWLVWLPV